MTDKTSSRRNFLKGAVATTVGLAAASTGVPLASAANKTKTSDKKKPVDHGKPNILIISCDQLACDAISANGNKDIQTPGIDRIFNNGTSFNKNYCQYPLCGPSRASFWTGLLPHQTGVTGNTSAMVHNRTPSVGSAFSEAGYDTLHLGKTHDFGALRGFDVARENLGLKVKTSPAYPESYQSQRDRVTIDLAKEYLSEDHDKPFVLAVEFYNPHNINNWIGEFKGKHGDIEGMGPLPPLRPNYDNEDMRTRPFAIKYACDAAKRQSQVSQWDDKNYRQYLNAYYHFTNMADDLVSQVLDALEQSDAADNTLVVFLSDHGDAMGSHKLVAKAAFFYEETTRVPFVLMGKGIKSGQRIDALTGLCDLLPTLCDYADIKLPKGKKPIYGKSVLPLLKDEAIEGRTSIVSQWSTMKGKNVQPARMLRTEDFKYTHYLEDNGEELYDMTKDPGETTNLINNPAYTSVLSDMRQEFETYLKETKDPYRSLKVKHDKKFGKHKVGYHNHG